MKNLLKSATTIVTTATISTSAMAHTGGFNATHDMEHLIWLVIPVVAITIAVGRSLRSSKTEK